MYVITANENQINVLGYAGENEARQMVFNYPAEWFVEYPDGELLVHVRRAGDNAIYTAAMTENDLTASTLTWTITDDETSFSGTGEAQLCLLNDGVVVKSQRYATVVNQSTAAVTPTDPPPDTVIEEAVENYLEQYVDVITVNTHGEDGQILQSNGDGSYSWLTVTDPIIDSDTGMTLVPTRDLHRLANAVRNKTHYEGDLSVQTMADALNDTMLWSTEDLIYGRPFGDIVSAVGQIPANSFYYNRCVQALTLPFCTQIGANAFSDSSVTRVIAPLLTSIGGGAFSRCQNLTYVEMPNLISQDATGFVTCTALREIALPSLEGMRSSFFQGCTALETVSLPNVEFSRRDNQTETPDNWFQRCYKLKSVELPKYRTGVHNNIFDDCQEITRIAMPLLQKITGTNNFRNCYKLTELYLPSLEQLSNNNFAGCTSLKRICLYVKPTTLGTTALNAPALEDIYVPWSQGEVAGAPWGAPAGCTVHYNTVYDEDGEPIV